MHTDQTPAVHDLTDRVAVARATLDAVIAARATFPAGSPVEAMLAEAETGARADLVAALDQVEPAGVFVPGEVYTGRMIGDHDAVFSYLVVSRTAKFVTIEDVATGARKRCGVIVTDGDEWVRPDGRYSFAPILRSR